MNWFLYIYFFYLGFCSRTFTNHRTAGEGEGISLTPHYHFHPLHRHLDISRAITAESSPLHIASNRTRTRNLISECKSLTTKLRALYDTDLRGNIKRDSRKQLFLNRKEIHRETCLSDSFLWKLQAARQNSTRKEFICIYFSI